MESENLGSRHAALSKRRSSLFKKANELAILCDAEVGIIIINPDGNISEFASSTSSIQKIVARFKTCYEFWKRRSLKPKKEEPKKEVIQPRQNTKEHKLRNGNVNVLGKDLDLMSLDELDVLLEKLNQGLMSLKETKMQLLNKELEQSRIQQEEVLQTNQILTKQVEDLQALAPQINYPVPALEVHFPDMEGNGRTSSREYVSSSSLAAPPPITNGHSFQNADTTSLPSTANFSVPIAFDYGHLVEPAHRASTSSAAPVSVSSSQKIYTTKPHFHWLPNDAPPSGTSLTL